MLLAARERVAFLWELRTSVNAGLLAGLVFAARG